MRRFALALAALALGACGQNENVAAPEACARSATHAMAWTQSEARDVITTTAHGPSCRQAAVTFVVRNAARDPLWVFASSYDLMTIGAAAPADAPPVTPEQMDAFLTAWADVTMSQTSALPEWRADAATLTESATTFAYDTPFARETYEALRAADLRMICFAAGVETSRCLIVDPASGEPAQIVTYGP